MKKELYPLIILILLANSVQALTNIDTCRELNIPNEEYVLTSDVESDGTCFTITADGITLDLNGRTVTYNANPVPDVYNNDFETGDFSGWDNSNAPLASVVPISSAPTVYTWWVKQLVQNNVLKMTAPESAQTLTSTNTITLTPGRKYTISYMVHSASQAPLDNLAVTLIPDICPSCNCDDGTGFIGAKGSSGYFDIYKDYWAAAGNRMQAYYSGSGRCSFDATTDNYQVYVNFRGLAGNTNDIYIDAIEIKPVWENGIESSGDDVTIINGDVFQGPGKGYHSSALRVMGSNIELSYLHISTRGADTMGMNLGGDNHQVHHNIFDMNVSKTHQSHDPNWWTSAIVATYLTDSDFHSNNIIDSPSGIAFPKGCSNIYVVNNNISLRALGIHSYAVSAAGFDAGNPSHDIHVLDNHIDNVEGSGIFATERGNINDIRNNYIEVRDGAKEERAWTGKGIWIRSCYPGDSIYVINNTIIGYAGIDYPEVGRNSAIDAVRIGCSGTTTEKVHIKNNTIAAYAVTEMPFADSCSGEPYAAAISTGGRSGDDLLKVIENNVIKTNHHFVRTGNSDAAAGPSIFISNILIKDGTPISGYKPFLLGPTYSPLIFLNTTGEDIRDYHCCNYGSSRDTYINWYLDIEAKDGLSPATGATVEIYENGVPAPVTIGTIDSTGMFKTNLSEIHYHVAPLCYSEEVYTPHTVYATYQSETKNQTITLNESMRLLFSFDGSCTDGELRPCGITDVGACKYGNQSCVDGAWSECTENIDPVAEDCENGLDDDCDNLVDLEDTVDCSTNCTLPYDEFPCDCIATEELAPAISGWKTGNIDISVLFDILSKWKSGC